MFVSVRIRKHSESFNMDILNPKLVWIDGRCYRQLPVRESLNVKHEEPVQPVRPQIHVDDDYEYSSLPIKHEGDKFYKVFMFSYRINRVIRFLF
ncbi:hypothetical protein TNCT_707611 [Trichonephila clavata]|uniref:Uncharacterized protein n=1 Tax=Trichonephila clavata TaxID=2740835 RepID=A0A8X6HIG4_TRICU|nr:hypothetical protein TNCT_707611 [Trichonephila clavata]